jgi:hypothetical protein
MLLDALRDALRPNVRNLAAVATFTILLVASQLVANTALRYGLYLVLFVAWMAWFVETCVAVLRRWNE